MSAMPLLFIFTVATLFTTVPAFSAEIPADSTALTQLQIQLLKNDNDLLVEKIRQLESIKCVSTENLRLKKAQKLKDINADVRAQRRTTKEFEGFVKWMSTNLAGYNSYLHAGSYAAVFARVLPIPYAGQASIFTKFVSQFTVALNEASVSINNYLNSSWKYIEMTDPIDLSREIDEKAVSEAADFADRQMLKDMNDAKAKLAAVSDLSSGALSFLESINSYVSSTDAYWNKAKGLVRKNVDPGEKSYLSESTYNLKTQADIFNSRLKDFESLGNQEIAGIKALAVYDELSNLAKPLSLDKR